MPRIHIARQARSMLLGSTRQWQLEEGFRWLRIESLHNLHTIDHRWRDYPQSEKLSRCIGRQSRIQAQRAMWTECEARTPELKSAAGNSVVKYSERTVLIEGQNHYLGLHEPQWRSETESHRLGGRRNRRQSLPEFHRGDRGRYRSDSGRSGYRDVRCLVSRKPWIEPHVDCLDLLGSFAFQNRYDEDPI
jgi:hypothetical protein